MKFKRGLLLLMLAGGFLLFLLIAYYGFAAIAAAVLTAGWGLVGVAAFHLVPMACSALAWQALMSGAWRAGLGAFLLARWIRESVDALLPVGQVGGELIGARILAKRGAQPNLAVAGCIVDMTMEVITQFFFGLVGLALLVAHHGFDGTVYWIAVGACVAAPALLGFVLAQRWGLFRLVERALETLAEWLGLESLGRMSGLHDAIATLHRHHRGLALGFLWHFLSWLIGAGEIWLALRFLGQPVGLGEALILESLGQAVRSAAFVVPGALGVQEGGYMLLVGLLGIDAEMGLSLSLVKRVRDLILGLPGLAAWQVLEGRRLLRPGHGSDGVKGG